MLVFVLESEINEDDIYKVRISYSEDWYLYCKIRHKEFEERIKKKLGKYHNDKRTFIIRIIPIKKIGSKAIRY